MTFEYINAGDLNYDVALNGPGNVEFGNALILAQLGPLFAIKKISYASHSKEGLEATRAVDFMYEERHDIIRGFYLGMDVVVAYRLNAIEMYGPNHTMDRKYLLSYNTAGTSKRSRLSEVRECDVDQRCRRPTSFQWSNVEVVRPS